VRDRPWTEAYRTGAVYTARRVAGDATAVRCRSAGCRRGSEAPAGLRSLAGLPDRDAGPPRGRL